MTTAPGVIVVGGVIVLTGSAIRTAADACLIAVRSRRLSGWTDSHALTTLAEALLAASANGHTDTVTPALPRCFPLDPTVGIEEAAELLNISRRQARRLAPRLGGRIIAGRWLLDPAAITEHIEGRQP